jgi:hypothetical protein
LDVLVEERDVDPLDEPAPDVEVPPWEDPDVPFEEPPEGAEAPFVGDPGPASVVVAVPPSAPDPSPFFSDFSDAPFSDLSDPRESLR